MIAYHDPSVSGYPSSPNSISLAMNIQDVSEPLNDTSQAELLLFSGVESAGSGSSAPSSPFLVDGFLGA